MLIHLADQRPDLRAAVDYWADYPDDVDAWVDRAERESKSAEERWRRERRLLAG